MKSLYALTLAILLTGCGWFESDDPKPPATFSSFPANVFPFGLPIYQCGTPGAPTNTVMQKLNAFWQSGVVACACQLDAFGAGCTSNALVFQQNIGYIYYDSGFLTSLDLGSGSTLPADFVMAHEFGHNVQLGLGLSPSTPMFRELQADCLGGYYVGSRIRLNEISQFDLVQSFNTGCAQGDAAGTPWWSPSAHGTCQQRVSAMQQGISGNLNGLLPGQACPTA